MPKDFKDLPFDQFQRYSLARSFADAVRPEPGKPLKVLDVGGYPGLMIDFLPADDVTVVDVIEADNIVNYVQAGGEKLPFADASFDLVCTCDTLEHVPKANRESFLDELVRVTGDYIFLTAPFADDRTEMAEEILYGYVERVLKADFVTLREHIENGLPECAPTINHLGGAGVLTADFPSGYLYHWLPMMLAKHHLMAYGDTESLHRRVDRFYNINFSEDDFREPSYRRVIVGSKKGDRRIKDYAAQYKEVANSASPVMDTDRLESFRLLAGLLDFDLKRDVGRMLGQLQETSEGDLKRARNDLAEKDRQINDLQSIVEAQNESLDELYALVTKVRNFGPYRLYSRLFRRR